MGFYTDQLKQLVKAKNLNYVGTRGDVHAPVCFLGEAPGADEDAIGVPFVGYSGKLADSLLSEAGFSQSEVWFTNPYKVRPPDNDIDRLSELGIPREAFEAQFFEELEETKPTFIIAAGATPLSILCPNTLSRRTEETPVGRWRGSLLTSPRLNWPHYVIPVYHPAFILRDWSEKETNVFCLRRVKEELEYWKQHGVLQPLPSRELIAEPSYDDVVTYLNECLQQKGPISVDIELLRRRIPYCVSFAKSPCSGISVGLWDFDDTHGVVVWRLAADILQRKAIIGQNITSFDYHWLSALGFVCNINKTDDTRIRHSVLWPELSHKLEFMVMQYTREPFYKDEGRGWNPRSKESVKQFKIYNCKDSTCTYEVFLGQEEEFNERPRLKSFYETHEMPLARRMFDIERRGVETDPRELLNLRSYIDTELDKSCARIGQIVGKPVARNKATASATDPPAVNLGSQPQVKQLLKDLGLKVPRVRGSGKESTGEEQLNVMFAETGHPFLKELLAVREFSKIGGTYVDAKLVDNTLYCVYKVGGTVTGRRSSGKNPLGFGTNHQNQPKHSPLGKRFRSCIVAREGKIFIECDQVGAEDWIINGIIADQSGDRRGINELQSGIDRHQRLASFIFGVPADQCDREAPTIYRYVGKRTRYAGSYGMGGKKFAAVLAKEGYALPQEHCDFLLQKFHQYDPGIREVFQRHIEKEVIDKRLLINLFGRERQFMAVHPYRDNSDIFRDAYSYIPQGTVGDNTGAAILVVEAGLQTVVMETHDALVLEVVDDVGTIFNAVGLLKRSFDRVLTFPNGFQVNIPIEIGIGYNLKDITRCVDLTLTGLTNTHATLQQHQNRQVIITGGALPQPSQPVLNAMSG